MQEILTDHFYDFLSAICEGDQPKIQQLAEKRFATKVINNLGHIKKQKLKFEKGEGLC